jgi:cob(I)alamin adenosyltransferase
MIQDGPVREMILEIQDRLFTIGSSLACDPVKEPGMRLPDLKEDDVRGLEQEIDRMSEAIPPMRSFILPGGHPVVSQLHIARCVCRRSERCCVRLELESLEVEGLLLKYLNRLSDYLFVLSRYMTHLLGVEEISWKPRV